jgi:hypothetical protein
VTQCDELIELAKRQVLSQARAHSFSQLRVQLAQQSTAAGTNRFRSFHPAGARFCLPGFAVPEATIPGAMPWLCYRDSIHGNNMSILAKNPKARALPQKYRHGLFAMNR